MLSVVIPTLNAAPSLAATLASLPPAEVVVVDGGSQDDTAALAGAHGARVVHSSRGRGLQLARGAAAATGDWLLFLHADTRLTPEARAAALAYAYAGNSGRAAAFAFALDEGGPAAARLERIVAWRSRALALPYGDQGLLIARTLYDAVGGYAPLPLMEDVDLVRRLGRQRIALLDARAVTSARRYRQGGWVMRPARNLACLSLYFLGLPPRLVAKLYG